MRFHILSRLNSFSRPYRRAATLKYCTRTSLSVCKYMYLSSAFDYEYSWNQVSGVCHFKPLQVAALICC